MYLFIINFNKLNLLMYSNAYFLKVHDNILLNERISIFNRHHRCLNNQSNELILNDPTDTFDIGKNFNLILKKHLNAQQQRSYDLTLQQKQKNSTDDTGPIDFEFRSLEPDGLYKGMMGKGRKEKYRLGKMSKTKLIQIRAASRPAKKDRWTEVSNFSNRTNLIALYWPIILAVTISFYFPNDNRIISSPT
ncbi:unnamed protein product [Rotaria magnacalcarata]|uniref:Uncharacterized protein n=1 Tax=Rotaria magnacalcarata TaxID=392030 RepID=A0A8S3E8C9_9BILA|nr:unnamed protein product [Rotaria magnacalcarata]